MDCKWIFGLGAAVVVGAAGFAATQGLVRVHPPASNGNTAPRQHAVAIPEADVTTWRAQLSEADLDLREQAFERALGAASRQPPLRDALREWAGSIDDPELAWTCRLLLRELSLARRWPTAWPSGRSPAPNPGSFHGATTMEELLKAMEDLHGNLDQLFEAQDGMLPGIPVPTEGGTSRGLQLRTGPDGVECEVTTEEDGRKVTRKYQAATLEELLQQHPELRDSVTLGGSGATRWIAPGAAGGLGVRPSPQTGASQQAPLRTDLLGVVVGTLPAERARQLGLEEGPGLTVERVEPGTLAEILGVRRGHVLVEINGRALHERDDISAALAEREAEADLVVVLIDRFGQRRTRVWKPEAPPAQRAEEQRPSSPRRF